MDATPIPITQEKYDDFVAELEHRKMVLRNEISERLIVAKEFGDLKENAEYHAARDDQGKNEARIREVEEILRRATVITKAIDGTVSLASEVTIQRQGTDEQKIFVLVGPEEADMAAGKLSTESPIGAALMGKTVGETVEITTPGGTSIFEIVAIA